MVFTSLVFLEFFLVVLVCLALLPTRTSRQFLILAASCFFYAYWKPVYLLLLATPSLIDYVCSIRIEDSKREASRFRWLLVSLVTNLALLGYFKYSNFFIENVSELLGIQPMHLNIVLPVGISFFTFKTLSYTIDVYRREIPASRSLWQYTMFVTYFPELVAGPIVRASVFLPQMTRSLKFSWVRTSVGLQIILLGFTKKLLVADRLSGFSDEIFSHPAQYSSFTVITGVLAYSLQIYCDFSGYSDIAIGVSKIIGFDLPENFNMPYLATSITEFWRRWHITLSQWLRDYLYKPLGGNRKGRFRTYVNLFIVMLLGGLWHGASWNFVFWGALHGTALAIHKIWKELDLFPAVDNGKVWKIATKIISWSATYLFVCFAWIFFRSQDFSTAKVIIMKVTGFEPSGITWVYTPFFICSGAVILGHAIGVVLAKRAKQADSRPNRITAPRLIRNLYRGAHGRFGIRPSPFSGAYVLLPFPGFLGSFLITLWILVIYLFAPFGTNPFIYFQF
ncbi:MAG: MBOAT family protein [Acidobacteriota bacterium]